MSNTIQFNIDNEKVVKGENGSGGGVKVNGSDNKQKNTNNGNTTLSTTISVASLDCNKNQRKDKNGVIIKKHMKKHKIYFNTNIQIIEIENYKSYNKESSFIFFEAFSDLPASCSSCIII
jgi:hypothetical protein